MLVRNFLRGLLFICLKHLKCATGWEKICTCPSMTIRKFLTVIKLTLYESFIDQMWVLFFKALPCFYCPWQCNYFFLQKPSERWEIHTSDVLFTLAQLDSFVFSEECQYEHLSMHVLISVTQQRIQKLHISGDEYDYNWWKENKIFKPRSMFLIHSLFSVSSKALFFSFSSLISLSVIQIYTHFECLILIFKFLGLPLPFVKFT